MPPFTGLGAALGTLRRRRGFTQSELGRRCGLSAGVISRYERGVQRPALGSLERLLDALGCDLGDLHHALVESGQAGHETAKTAAAFKHFRPAELLERWILEPAAPSSPGGSQVASPKGTREPAELLEDALRRLREKLVAAAEASSRGG